MSWFARTDASRSPTFTLGKTNERGKGEHRHIGEQEEDYDFTTVERLLDDFERDIANWSDL